MATAPESVTEAPAPAAIGSRTPLAVRIFLVSALLIALAVGAAVLVTYVVGSRIAGEAVGRALADSVQAQRAIGEQRLQLLERTIQLVAADPALVTYVATALGDELGLGEEGGADAGSIHDLLVERQAQFGFDLGIVLDSNGGVIARSDTDEAFAEDLADDALVAPALSEVAPQSGYWRSADALYQAAVMPLSQDQTLAGFLLLAQRVDDRFSAEIARTSDAQIAFWLPARDGLALAASSLAPERAEELARLLAARTDIVDAVALGRSLDAVAIELGGEPWLLQVWPTASAAAAELGATSALASRVAASQGYRSILNLVVVAGLGSLLLALPISLWLSRRALRPARLLAEAAERAAAGDYRASVAVAGTDELARLGRALDSLLSSLREKSDTEAYLAEFSRSLPEPDAVGGRVPAQITARLEPPQSGTMVLLGVELAPSQADDAAAALAAAGNAAVDLADLAAATGGRLLAGEGERWILGFAGPERLPGALAAARAALTELGADDVRPALALTEGEVVGGSFDLDGRPGLAALGTARRHLDRLLCESGPGSALLARTLGDQVRERYGTEALRVATGALAGRRYYALRPEGLGALPEPQADPDRTSEAPTVATAPADAGLAPGTELGGRYQVLAQLGAGGMGVVYKARDLELDDIVALKMLRPGALTDRDQLERLKEEIKLARRITHPNVLRTYDFGEIRGQPYISMEYVRGVTLRELLDQSGRLPYSAALRIARQLAAGLAAAHAVGVLHRDIKPANLILEAGGNARLMDFGIARPMRRDQAGHTQPGMYLGTPRYSPPEQLSGEPLDARADIYATGVVMCEMFCGGLPYAGSSTMEIYMAQVQQPPVRPSEMWPEIPPELERVILRCIARRPEDRFGSAQELADALSELRA
ncbi:MAG TPA: protein kinase [Xanthomonadaceae bacterium]|nr:protein kinase [Xanthomonadaceae bacterium]